MCFTEEQGDNGNVVSLNFLSNFHKFWHNFRFSHTSSSLKI